MAMVTHCDRSLYHEAPNVALERLAHSSNQRSPLPASPLQALVSSRVYFQPVAYWFADICMMVPYTMLIASIEINTANTRQAGEYAPENEKGVAPAIDNTAKTKGMRNQMPTTTPPMVCQNNKVE